MSRQAKRGPGAGPKPKAAKRGFDSGIVAETPTGHATLLKMFKFFQDRPLAKLSLQDVFLSPKSHTSPEHLRNSVEAWLQVNRTVAEQYIQEFCQSAPDSSSESSSDTNVDYVSSQAAAAEVQVADDVLKIMSTSQNASLSIVLQQPALHCPYTLVNMDNDTPLTLRKGSAGIDGSSSPLWFMDILLENSSLRVSVSLGTRHITSVLIHGVMNMNIKLGRKPPIPEPVRAESPEPPRLELDSSSSSLPLDVSALGSASGVQLREEQKQQKQQKDTPKVHVEMSRDIEDCTKVSFVFKPVAGHEFTHGEWPFTVKLVEHNFEPVCLVILPNADLTEYHASASIAQPAKLHVKSKGVHVEGSPFNIPSAFKDLE
jgi:hypothetical protein